MTGHINVGGNDVATKVAFNKNCHPFVKCEIQLNDEHVEDSDNLNITMSMYNLIEYCDNYSDSTASLYQFKRQERLAGNTNLTVASSSFEYKSSLLRKPTNITTNVVGNEELVGDNPVWKNAQIIVPLKYI